MHEIKTELTLAAPVDRIWELLTDCPLYPQWNPLFPRAAGRLETGGRLEIQVKLPGMEPFTITPEVVSVEAPSCVCWRHTLLFAGLFSWRYCFELEASAAEQVSFVQRSTFGGVLAPLFTLALGALLKDSLAELNRAVKRWGEKGNVRCLKC